MQVAHIPLSDTGQMHPLTEAYLRGEERLRPYFAWDSGPAGIKEAIASRSSIPVDRETLVRVIEEQYTNLDPGFLGLPENQAVVGNLRALSSPKTFTVTTGHQLNIFTGPLYSIYKMVSAIAYARKLSETYLENRFVPVYWMASEDHDFDEINHIYLWGKKLIWQRGPGGATGDLETLSLRNSVLAELRPLLSGRPYGDELLSLFENAYSFPSLAQAHRALAHSLFREYGLVTIGANHAALKKQLIPVLEADIFENRFLEPLITTSEFLSQTFAVPVTPREINTFYLTPGRRSRIERKEGRYVAHNSDVSWTDDELRTELYTYPERFSPNVVLRPVYQEVLLPNLAYVGGTNEIAYWLQLKGVFEAAGVFYPQLVVRDSALWVGKKAAKDISASGLETADLIKPLDEVKAKFYGTHGASHPAERELDAMLDHYETLRKTLQGLPADLIAQVVKDINVHVKDVKKWKSYLHKRLEESEEVTVGRIEKLYGLFYPDKTFQERHDNFIALYMQYGPRWMEPLFAHFETAEPSLHIFSEE